METIVGAPYEMHSPSSHGRNVNWPRRQLELACLFIYHAALRASTGTLLALAGMDLDPSLSHCEVN